MLEVYLKGGKYVVQFKEFETPRKAFTVRGELLIGGSIVKIDRDYVPSEKSDGAMVVFTMSQEGRARVRAVVESKDSSRPVFMTLGPYQ